MNRLFSLQPLESRVLKSATGLDFGRVLPIAPRLQWDNNNGYCGETSVQAIALSCGTYVSEYASRQMFSLDQSHDLLLDGSLEQVLTDLKLQYEAWNSSAAAPQGAGFLAWTKREITAGAPVIAGIFVSGGSDLDYDHIIPLIGFHSSHDPTHYFSDDQIVYNDNYSIKSQSQQAGVLLATRTQAEYRDGVYYLPRNWDFGYAVKGIVDRNRETATVSLRLNRPDEPNVIEGESATTMQGTATITQLTPGKRYALLRYDDWSKVPDSAFLGRGGYKSSYTFIARSATVSVPVGFPSVGCVTYRCVPAPAPPSHHRSHHRAR